MAPIYGFQGQLLINSVRYDFLSESLACREDFVDTSGLRGSRSHVIERVRAGIRRVAGQITMQPTAVELATLLPWIHGAAASGTSYPLGDSLASFAYTIELARDDGTDGKVFTYTYCRVNRATFRASQGAPLTVTLDVVGSDETVGNAGGRGAGTIDTTTGPFMFHDLALSIASTSYSAKEVEVVIDNHIDTERFFNSQTLSATTNAFDRSITLRTSLPYGDAEAVYATGSSGVAVVATYTNGAVSLAQTFVKVAFPRRSPTMPGRQEIMLPLEGIAYRSSSTPELTTVLDSTP